jgi:hypothetical protein
MPSLRMQASRGRIVRQEEGSRDSSASALSDGYCLFSLFQKASLSSLFESQAPNAVPHTKDKTPTITAPAEIISDFLSQVEV